MPTSTELPWNQRASPLVAQVNTPYMFVASSQGILSHGTEKVEEEIFVVKGLQMSAGTPCHRSFGTSDQSECDRESGEPHRQVPGTLQRSRNTEGRVPHQA